MTDIGLNLVHIMDTIGEEEPSAAAVRLLESQFYAAAATYPSHRGGGTTGLIGAFMPAAQFAAMPGTAPWLDPVDPGPTPAAPANPTAANIQEARHVHTAAKAEFTDFHNARKELRALFLAHVHKSHYPGLEDAIMLYSNVCPGVLLQHMLTEHATVTDDELIENANKLKEPWDSSIPLAGLWARQEALRRFSMAHDEITVANMTRTTFTILEETGIYPETCRTWRLKTAAQKTWAQLQTDFKAADKLHRAQTNAGHFANLATTAAVWTPARLRNPPPPGPTITYCFTHGVTWNEAHTSLTCNHPCAGHIPTATIDNMQGGNNTISRQRGEIIHRPAQPQRRQRPGYSA